MASSLARLSEYCRESAQRGWSRLMTQRHQVGSGPGQCSITEPAFEGRRFAHPRSGRFEQLPKRFRIEPVHSSAEQLGR
jgi:hypothetical protein